MTEYERWEAKYKGYTMPDAPFPPDMMPCIQQFFRDIHPRLRPGQGVYDEVFATELFFPLQRKREMAAMLAACARVGPPCKRCDGKGSYYEQSEVGQHYNHFKCETCASLGTRGPRTVMEIGADKGGSLYHWCMLPSVTHVIACEIRGTPYAAEFERAFPHIQFYWVPRGSVAAAQDVFHWLQKDGLYLDVLFIDGDKIHMLKDFDAYRAMMSEGGVVFLHDIFDTGGPRDAWAELRRRGLKCSEIRDISEYKELAAEGRDPRTAWERWLLHWKGRSCGVGVVQL